MNESRQPVLFIPHGGGPCFFMDWTLGPSDTWEPLRAWLQALPDRLPAPPRALLVVSAHWEAALPTVQCSERPPLLYDYQGFPPHTYELRWDAPGSPALASRVQELMAAEGIESRSDDHRGFDHGVFVPLKVAFPQAQIPTVALSLVCSLDPAVHLAMGRALAPLRDEGVLLIGSGMSFHSFALFGRPEAMEVSRIFEAWLEQTVALPEEARSAALRGWAQGPMGRTAHPREEHLIPLMVAAGAAGADRGVLDFKGEALGARIASVHFGG